MKSLRDNIKESIRVLREEDKSYTIEYREDGKTKYSSVKGTSESDALSTFNKIVKSSDRRVSSPKVVSNDLSDAEATGDYVESRLCEYDDDEYDLDDLLTKEMSLQADQYKKIDWPLEDDIGEYSAVLDLGVEDFAIVADEPTTGEYRVYVIDYRNRPVNELGEPTDDPKEYVMTNTSIESDIKNILYSYGQHWRENYIGMELDDIQSRIRDRMNTPPLDYDESSCECNALHESEEDSMEVKDSIESVLTTWHRDVEEFVEDLTDLGYDVLEYNDEYIVFSPINSDEEYGLSVHGTESTKVVEWDSRFSESIDDLEVSDQEYTSAATSINSSKLPAIYKLVPFKKGDVVLDYGGGRFDNGLEYLESIGCTAAVFDPYNRSAQENAKAIGMIESYGGADIILLSNVLNVIKEEASRLSVLRNCKRLLNSSGTLYITVYEGDGKGNGSVTKSGYQLNKKTPDYIEEIEQVFSSVQRKGKLIIAE